MSTRTDLNWKNIGLHVLFDEIGQHISIFCDSVFTSQMALSFIGRNMILHKKVSTYKVYSVTKKELDTSFLDRKHKHKVKNGAPPDKF